MPIAYGAQWRGVENFYLASSLCISASFFLSIMAEMTSERGTTTRPMKASEL